MIENTGSSFAAVVPDSAAILPHDLFTYRIPEALVERAVPGVRVEVPFGRQTLSGVLVERLDHSDQGGVRAITAVLDDAPLLLPHHLDVARFVAGRYCAPLGEVLKAMLPAGIRSARRGGRKSGPRTRSVALEAARANGPAIAAPPLNAAQEAAVAPLLEGVATGTHRRVLLHGVTCSGKTEVYMRAIDATLDAGRQAIVLVPEIALTPQMIRRFAARFPGRIAVVHSALTEAERAAEWRRIRAGDVDVAVGSRSAIFAPFERPGLIVVDEEDSPAYKQDRVPRYHAIDVALHLGQLRGIPVIMGSATPRVESFWAAHTGRLELASLPRRVSGRPLPGIEVVDLREELRAGNRSPLSLDLQRALRDCHDGGGQSILFLNRRGTATVVVCRACGEALGCDDCSVSLVYHHGRRSCDCHYCGATRPLPQTCPLCGSPAIRGLGLGTERLEAEVRSLFPGLQLLRMDRDTTTGRDAYFTIYDAFRDGQADCLIGTQMVAKGWDLGNVRLVGIVNADGSLHFPDYRSGELTFSLLTQVAGRAGRGDESARVILQTYSPDHYAVRRAIEHDYIGFAREEVRLRRRLRFPPFVRLAVCTMTGSHDDRVEAAARQEVAALSGKLGNCGVDVLGPTPAHIHRLRGGYRWQFTVRGDAIEVALPHLPRGRGWSIDVDPAA